MHSLFDKYLMSQVLIQALGYISEQKKVLSFMMHRFKWVDI